MRAKSDGSASPGEEGGGGAFEPFPITPLRFPGPRELIAASGGRGTLRRLLRARGDERRAIARDAVFRAAGGVTPTLAVDADGVRFHVNTADKEISRIVFIFGLYDRPLMHAAFAGLRRLGGPGDFGGRLLLDVGANIGTTTLTACAHFAAGGAAAFEPDPTNQRFLEMNVRDNGLADRVRIHRAAVSDASGTLRLERSEYNAGDHRVRGRDEEPEASGDVIDVRAVALDDLIEAGELDLARVGAVWVDVQGHEGQALAGALRVLEAGVPIVLEYWPHGLRAAGGFDTLNELIAGHHRRFLNLGRPQDGPEGFTPLPVGELGRIAERYAGEHDHADLLLLPPGLDG